LSKLSSPPDDPGLAARPDAFFLPLQRGRRFCIRYEPKIPAARRGALVYIHPFAEEMNKSRRMAALQARALAEAGWTVLQVDLYGCGDSDGEFGDADWGQWRVDVADAAAWLHEQTGITPSLWGLRAGCLLACEAAATMHPRPNLLLWQPVLAGKQSLQQFLRLKVTAQALGQPATNRSDTGQLRAQLMQGDAIDVAGYELSPGLAQGLDAAELTPPDGTHHIAWLEVAASVPAELSPAARTRIDALQAAGRRVDASAVSGAAFWQTLEITECPELVAATLGVIARWQT
jgi:exosortase A-associated hydrolase 2